jgi:hypothetical protein
MAMKSVNWMLTTCPNTVGGEFGIALSYCAWCPE